MQFDIGFVIYRCVYFDASIKFKFKLGRFSIFVLLDNQTYAQNRTYITCVFSTLKHPVFPSVPFSATGVLIQPKEPSSDGNLMLLYCSYFVVYRQKLSSVQSTPHTQYQVNGSQCLQHVLDMTQDIYLI